MTRYEAMLYLLKQVTLIANEDVQHLCNSVLDEHLFQDGFGSQDKHHAYPGGLVVHTAEVLKIALAMAECNEIEVKADVLRAAAIFHDYLKIRDYNSAGKKTRYHSQIRHVAGSYAAWENACYSVGFPVESFRDDVGHCILAHHGRKEWGSPIEPQTVEAHILHYADMLSCTFGKGKEQEKTNE